MDMRHADAKRRNDIVPQIDARHVVPLRREAHARDEAHITSADNCNAHHCLNSSCRKDS